MSDTQNADDIDSVKIDAVDFEVLPEDVYKVVISAITKIEDKKYQSEEKETKFRFEFTVLEGDYEGRKMFQKVRTKLAGQPKPSNLWMVWKAVDGGKEHSKEEYSGFHISSLINRNLKITTENVTKGNATYSNVKAYLPLKEKPASERTYDDDIDEALKSNVAADEGNA